MCDKTMYNNVMCDDSMVTSYKYVDGASLMSSKGTMFLFHCNTQIICCNSTALRIIKDLVRPRSCFEPPPSGSERCYTANVAEGQSLTIPLQQVIAVTYFNK